MPERPDLSDISPEVRAYIEALEDKLQRLQSKAKAKPAPKAQVDTEPEPSEDPTPVNVVTISKAGMVKRTPRHFYSRQGRGGMGVFDLDTSEDDYPAILALADQSHSLLIITDQARTYRLPLRTLSESPVRARGVDISQYIPLRNGEHVVAALPADPKAGKAEHIALLGERGWVNRVRRSFLGPNLIPGVSFYDAKEHGPLVAACWFADGDDLFVAARSGTAIRFPAKRVPTSGTLGIRLDKDDMASAVTAVTKSRGVFLLSDEGKGTIRLMEGFRANKSPGGGGKIALKTDHLVAAKTVPAGADLFVISRNSKIIRFSAEEIPPKTGTVQGVNCMALRSDQTVAVAVAEL